MNIDLHQSIRAFERKQIAVSALGLIVLVAASVVLNYLYVSEVAEQSAKFISRMIQLRDFREVAITLQEARLDRFESVQYQSADKSRSFVLPESAELLARQDPFQHILYDGITIMARDPQGANSQDRIVFAYNRFSLVPWAILFWMILNLVSIPPTRFIKRRMTDQYERELGLQKDLARAELAKKVRHNIRTPLSALLRLSGSAKGLSSQEGELFQSIIEQIRALISELDDSSVQNLVKVGAAQNLFECLKTCLNEIRLVAPQRVVVTSQIEDSVASAFVRYDALELRSLLSNLVTNSIEAIPQVGTVRIIVDDLGHEIRLQVADSGVGIPQEILSQVTEKGFSYGKENGTGLGLWHANEMIKAWGGRFKIESSPAQGTVVSIFLPVLQRTSWYTPRIKISNSDAILILDDQPAAHQLWKMRLQESGYLGEADCFYSAKDAITAFNGRWPDGKRVVVFADYDLGDSETNGISFLSGLPKQLDRFLVTGHFDESEVQESCSRLGIGLIAKTQLVDLPIVVLDGSIPS